MLILTHAVHPGEAVFIRYEGPKGSGMPEMFYTTEAISSDPALARKHRAHHRRPFLRCLKGAGHRPRQPGGCGRRADRTCGGGRPHPYRHPRAQPVHHRSKRRRENAGTDGGDPRCTPCCVESPSAPIYKRCAPVLYPTRRIAHARRLYGIVHCPSIGRTSPFRMRERESCDNG